MPDRLGAPPAGPVLILTPTGRDAEGAAALLSAEGIESRIYRTLAELRAALDDAAGAVLLADEALFRADLDALAERLAAQPPWSDLPFIVLIQAGIAARRQMAELNLPGKLGNVMFLERPLSALSLVSAVRSALRARQRQRQGRDYLAEQVGAAERQAALLEARVRERTAALEETERERQKIAAALAQAQKMEAVGQLTGGLAHDFNNMLTGIVGSLELLQTRLAQGRIEQFGRYIGMVQQGARRAAALTQRLLAFSRRQTLDPKPTSLNTLVTGMTELIRSTVGPGIAIETVLREELWLTLCDPHQLENALLNLCINARDAMPEGGQLTIETENTRLTPVQAAALPEARPGEYAVMCVTDTGCAMPPEVIARVFDPFFTTKPLGQGTGLGLSMIYGFVQQSGGHVQISSVVHGSAVWTHVALPAFGVMQRGHTSDIQAQAYGSAHWQRWRPRWPDARLFAIGVRHR
ncbi:ATP-binding protein [Paracraurococcus lichenis]|uniref:histidine kinase n=1 Tax=Paracraurococcus lichenis TaxID=3064888 RepID=A0ABT9ECY2_9PROT|nr:ATP-binding protein [Paracraurococcus sp. LOR1-02]MDO9714073.1 ATP-binding protein [Paracraurococcus sp. LOR1-02]